MPILELIKRWRNSCGEDAWVAMPYLKSLIEKAHAKGIPVIYTTGVRREDNWDSGSWSWKNGRSDEDLASKPATNVDGNEIVAEIAPAPQDIVMFKQKPSGFFGTNMASYLTLLGCDSVIVTGTTTSGCVRATVLDAFSLNYRIALAEEGCFDRSQASHAINLCDMNAKYADVVKTSEVLAFFDSLPERHVRPAEGLGRAAAQAQDGREFLTGISVRRRTRMPRESGAFLYRLPDHGSVTSASNEFSDAESSMRPRYEHPHINTPWPSRRSFAITRSSQVLISSEG